MIRIVWLKLMNNSKIRKIRLIKYENMKDKYPVIVFDKIKFYFDSENLEFSCEEIYDNKDMEKNINEPNENYVEEEHLFLVELNGGAIALGKNQKIKLFK